MRSRIAPHQPLAAWPTVLFLASMATFVQAFIALKLFFLVVFLLAAIANLAHTHRFVLHLRLATFYLVMSLAGIVWSLVGLFHPNNYVQGILDASRLYLLWSAAFLIIYSLLRSAPSLQLIHRALVLSGLLIPLINFAGLADTYFGLDVIPDTVRESLQLYVGIYDGYIQIGSQNIGSMFLIAPYLVTSVFRTDSDQKTSSLTRLSLLLSVTLVAVSGRRALWLVVALTPFMIIALSTLTKSYGLLTIRGRAVLLVWASAVVLTLGVVVVQPEHPRTSTIGRVQEAFSSQDERSLQRPFLISAFREAPLLGSGFGAYAGYLRSEQRPWTYELTYHKLLFNMGIIGTTILAGLILVYLAMVITLLRRCRTGTAIPAGLLVAFVSLLLGAYSNPYFGSFDFLFFVGLLPYLSTFQDSFECPIFAPRSLT